MSSEVAREYLGETKKVELRKKKLRENLIIADLVFEEDTENHSVLRLKPRYRTLRYGGRGKTRTVRALAHLAPR